MHITMPFRSRQHMLADQNHAQRERADEQTESKVFALERYPTPVPHFPFDVTQTSTGARNLPAAGLPTWIRSAVTSSPVSRLKDAHGLGMRPKVIFWMGWPVAAFMIVAMILIGAG